MSSILDNLNDKQREAAGHIDGPLLIIAGAGSGKTRVLTHRVAYLIKECGVNPYNIMAITFTNKAAGEMRERVDRIVGEGCEAVWVQTFHATCVRILRRHIHEIGFDNNFTIYDTDDSKTVMKRVLKKLNVDPKYVRESTVLRAISDAKNDLIGPDEYADRYRNDYSKRTISQAYDLYQDMLRDNNALDFDDLLRLTVALFKNCPEVLENYQHRFKYIMVDEYQDTNNAQFELVRLLAKEHGNLCVVGDDDQSIYKFRGANIGNILGFESNFPGAKVVKLEQNYRSTKNILDAANAVIANNTGRKPKRLWTDREEEDPVFFSIYDNSAEEAEGVVSEIERLKSKGLADYGDCAILYRTNAQSREFEARFVRDGVPYFIVGGVNFYSRREVKDMLAYLKTVDSGRDDVSVRRIINVPKRGIGATTIEKIAAFADDAGLGFYEACGMADEIPGLGKSASKVLDFVNLIDSFRKCLEENGPTETLKMIVDETDYQNELKEEDADDASERIGNIDELINTLRQFEDDEPEGTLSQFLEDAALVSDLDSADEDTSRVMLMTVHSAKGLEFPRVFLCGMEDGVFPGYMSINSDDPDDIEEERRLAYVAITRAQDVLYISSARARMVRGETQYNPVSRFIKEIPEEMLERGPSGNIIGGRTSYKSSYRSSMPERKIADDGKPQAPIFKKNARALMASGGLSGSVIQKGAALAGTKPDYEVGDRVMHLKFGEGEVLAIEKGPRDYQVTVNFDNAGQKIMYAAFAKLEKMR